MDALIWGTSKLSASGSSRRPGNRASRGPGALGVAGGFGGDSWQASEGFALRGLPFQEKGLWEAAFPANLEGAEILVPRPFGHFRLRLDPKAQLIEVGDRDSPVAHAVH